MARSSTCHASSTSTRPTRTGRRLSTSSSRRPRPRGLTWCFSPTTTRSARARRLGGQARRRLAAGGDGGQPQAGALPRLRSGPGDPARRTLGAPDRGGGPGGRRGRLRRAPVLERRPHAGAWPGPPDRAPARMARARRSTGLRRDRAVEPHDDAAEGWRTPARRCAGCATPSGRSPADRRRITCAVGRLSSRRRCRDRRARRARARHPCARAGELAAAAPAHVRPAPNASALRARADRRRRGRLANHDGRAGGGRRLADLSVRGAGARSPTVGGAARRRRCPNGRARGPPPAVLRVRLPRAADVRVLRDGVPFQAREAPGSRSRSRTAASTEWRLESTGVCGCCPTRFTCAEGRESWRGAE